MNDILMMQIDYAGPLTRCTVLGATFKGPRPPDLRRLRVIHRGPWRETEAEAKAEVMPRYFEIYADRNGFRHPDDPLFDREQLGNASVLVGHAA